MEVERRRNRGQRGKIVEEGGGVEEEGLLVQQLGTYEVERNKRVAKVQEWLQLLLSAKCNMWVGPIFGFLLFLGCGCFFFPFTQTGTGACGQWSLAKSYPPVILYQCHVLEDHKVGSPIPLFWVRCNWCLHCCLYIKLEYAYRKKLGVFGVQIQATLSNPCLLSTFFDVWLQGWQVWARDCGCGPSACSCEPKIAEPIQNHERTHTRVRSFFGGGGNDGLLGTNKKLGVVRKHLHYNGSSSITGSTIGG